MRLFITTIAAIIILLFISRAFAEQSPDTTAAPAKPSTWSAEIGVGYVKTSGNTDTESLKGDIKAAKEIDKWRHSIKFEGLNTSDSGITTAERYFLSGKTDYKFTEHSYWYVTASYDDDHFSGYDYRISESAGYGRRLIDQSNLSLDGEIGPGARQSKTDNGEKDNESLLRLAANLAWKITGNSEFTQDLFTEIGQDATISKSVTALSANINSNLAMKLSYTVKHTSTVPVGIEKTDTEAVVTIVYKYK
jgi:putative salt-induced outer membrane protein